MSLLHSLVSRAFQSARLIHKEKIANHTYHLRLRLKNGFKNYTAGQQLRVLVGLENVTALSDLVRTYSVWHYNPNQQAVDLAVCTFSNGPGAKWATEIEAGETVYFRGPEGKFVIDHAADTYLFLGDISALAPLYMLARQVKGKKIQGIVYASDKADFFPDQPSEVHFQRITSTENHSQKIISAVDALKIPASDAMVYIAGETSFCRDLTSYFRNTAHWPTKQIKTKPFWHPHKKGLE